MPFQAKFNPPMYDLETEGNVTSFQAWEKQWTRYKDCTGLHRESRAKQAKVLMLCLSRETVCTVSNLGLSDE